MGSSAGIIIIGDEILSGRTKDTNITWIANELNEIGIKLKEARVIEDDKKTIINTVLEFSKKFTYVFTSGGIGPTHDDITTESIAAAFKVDLEKNEIAMSLLKKHYKRSNIDFNEARQKMAIIPKGASLINNPVSVAPGFNIKNVYVFAGVPKIMQSTAVNKSSVITFPPEIASTITIRLLLKPVDATAPTIIPAVAIAIATLIIFRAPFSKPVITLL